MFISGQNDIILIKMFHENLIPNKLIWVKLPAQNTYIRTYLHTLFIPLRGVQNKDTKITKRVTIFQNKGKNKIINE